jgi:hypothetical protein
MNLGDMDHLDEATLNDIADGRLAAARRTAADAHLESCATCRDALGAVQQVIALGSTGEAKAASPLLAIEPPPELWTVVAATTVHERLVRRHVLRAMRGTLALVALALVAASSATTVGVMRFVQGGAGPRAIDSPQVGPESSAAQDVRRATYRQLAALANAEVAELRAIERSGRRAEAERQLAALDSVLAGARKAVLAAPEDHERLRVIEDVYRRRHEVIRGVLRPR